MPSGRPGARGRTGWTSASGSACTPANRLPTTDGYWGPDVDYAVRLAAAGHAGQVLRLGDHGAAGRRGGRGVGAAAAARLPDAAAAAAPRRGRRRSRAVPATAYPDGPVPACRVRPERSIGRAGELDDVTRRLSRGGRFVTLVGAPGVGTTGVAVEAAHRLSPRFESVGFAALDGLAHEAVPAALARARRTARAAGHAAARAARRRAARPAGAARARRAMSPAVAEIVATLIAGCAGVHVPRHRAGTGGDAGADTVQVGPLAVPPPGAPLPTCWRTLPCGCCSTRWRSSRRADDEAAAAALADLARLLGGNPAACAWPAPRPAVTRRSPSGCRRSVPSWPRATRTRRPSRDGADERGRARCCARWPEPEPPCPARRARAVGDACRAAAGTRGRRARRGGGRRPVRRCRRRCARCSGTTGGRDGRPRWRRASPRRPTPRSRSRRRGVDGARGPRRHAARPPPAARPAGRGRGAGALGPPVTPSRRASTSRRRWTEPGRSDDRGAVRADPGLSCGVTPPPPGRGGAVRRRRGRRRRGGRPDRRRRTHRGPRRRRRTRPGPGPERGRLGPGSGGRRAPARPRRGPGRGVAGDAAAASTRAPTCSKPSGRERRPARGRPPSPPTSRSPPGSPTARWGCSPRRCVTRIRPARPSNPSSPPTGSRRPCWSWAGTTTRPRCSRCATPCTPSSPGRRRRAWSRPAGGSREVSGPDRRAAARARAATYSAAEALAWIARLAGGGRTAPATGA